VSYRREPDAGSAETSSVNLRERAIGNDGPVAVSFYAPGADAIPDSVDVRSAP
jgi:hypothetical protein